jgi:ubiquitin C-terminal hydrolase
MGMTAYWWQRTIALIVSSKIKNRITFSTRCQFDLTEGPSESYSLFAVAVCLDLLLFDTILIPQNHIGPTRHSGHYTAAVKYANTWYYCNDSSVYELQEDQIATSDAYMLFYLRYNLFFIITFIIIVILLLFCIIIIFHFSFFIFHFFFFFCCSIYYNIF